MAITLRTVKGSPLTFAELDTNFSELDTLKAPKNNPTFTGTVSGITAAMVGLGNVTNESKATMFNNPTFTGTATFSGNVTGITAAMVGLGNVTNESKATMFNNPTFTGTVSGVTAAMVGLGNVTNESKATMFNNPTFTGTVSGITAAMVGLGNVTNESKATMFTNPTFTGTVSGVTAAHVGLGNVTNESKATMFNNPTFTGTASGTFSGSFSGNGSAITSLNASNLASGTVPSGVVSGSYTGISAVGASCTVNGFTIGYRAIPRSTTSGTAVTDDVNKCIAASAGITVPSGTFSAGDVFSIYNDSASSITITQGSGLTLRQAGTTNTGNRTLSARGMCTVWFNSSSEAVISGSGLS